MKRRKGRRRRPSAPFRGVMQKPPRTRRPLVQFVGVTRSTVPEPESTGSEVARLMAQITAEYESAQWALSGHAVGVSQHAFITARLENVERHREALEQLIGPEESTRMIVERMNKDEPPEGA